MLSKIKHQMKVSQVPSTKRIQKTDKQSGSPFKKFQDRYSSGKKEKADEENEKGHPEKGRKTPTQGGRKLPDRSSKHIDIVI